MAAFEIANQAPDVKVTAVVVTYNGAPWIVECLDSLRGSTIPVDVIVIDNASADETIELVRGFPNTEVIANDQNLGFGRANNIGIRQALAAGSTHVFLLNQDAWIASDTIEQLVALSRRQQKAGILCPMQFDDSKRRLDPTFLQHYLAPHAGPMIADAFRGELDESYEVQAAPAAAWLLTGECLRTVGGFDPLFFMYCEDDDLCRRARWHGFQVLVAPRARFYHCRAFHALTGGQSVRQRLRRRSSRIRSLLIHDLKASDSGLARSIWRCLIGRVLDGLGDGLARADLVGAMAAWLAVGRVILELPHIARHRRLSRRPGGHWVS